MCFFKPDQLCNTLTEKKKSHFYANGKIRTIFLSFFFFFLETKTKYKLFDGVDFHQLCFKTAAAAAA
jgi:hypothetical protein